MKELKVSLMHLMMLNRTLNHTLSSGNIAITDSIPAFAQAINTLKNKVTAIESDLAAYVKVITGITENKKATRLALAEFSFTVMSSVLSYAKNNKDEVLAAQMKTTLSNLKRMSYALVLPYINNTIKVITPLVSSLADYNITPSTISDWLTLRDKFNTLLTAPQIAIASRQTLGSLIEKNIKETIIFVKTQVDSLAVNFRKPHPIYYHTYKNTRKLIHTGIRHTGINAWVVNELGEPMRNATVTVDELTKDGKTFSAVTGTTDQNGFVRVSEFEPGFRTVSINNTVINKTFGPFQFINGKTITQTFTVQPAFHNLPGKTALTTPSNTSKN